MAFVAKKYSPQTSEFQTVVERMNSAGIPDWEFRRTNKYRDLDKVNILYAEPMACLDCITKPCEINHPSGNIFRHFIKEEFIML